MKYILLFAMVFSTTYLLAQEVDPDPTGNYENYCMKFAIESSFGMKSLLRGMSTTSYSVDSYFSHTLCQPDAFSDVVKCPMIHKVGDDPETNERKLQDLWWYYSTQRNTPDF